MAGTTAFVLALYHLGSRSLWGDEAFSVALAQEPAAEFWRVVSTSQANMSLYYALLRGWVVFGDDEAWIRLLSVVAAAAAVVVLYATAARLFDRRTATIAALLLATNPFLLHHAQEARAYSLVVLLTTVATLIFIAAEQRRRVGLDIAYVCVGAAALYAHFFAVFVLVGHLLALVVAGRSVRRQLGRLAGTLVLTLPLGWFALAYDAGQISQLARPTPRDVASVLNQLAGGTRLLTVLLGVGVLAATAQWLRRSRPRHDWPMVVAVTWATVPIAGALVASIGKPMFAARFLIVALPGIVLLAAVAVARLAVPFAAAAVVLMVALGVAHVIRTQGDPQEDFRAATAFVLQKARPTDAIAFYRTSRRIPFEYYTRGEPLGTLPRSLVPGSPYRQFDLIGDYRHTHLTTEELEAIRDAASSNRTWLFLSRFENERVREKRANRARLLGAVTRHARLSERRLFSGLDVRLYVPTAQ